MTAKNSLDQGGLSMPFVSVLIATYQRPEETVLAASSAAESDYPRDRFEVIVVDSSPGDETERAIGELCAKYPDIVRYVRKHGADGPGASRNLGAKSARGDIFAMFDSDCIAAPGWLAAAVEPFRADARLGVVQGRTLPNPKHPRGVTSRFVQVETPNCIFHSCNVLYRREAFEAAGGFSSEYDTSRRLAVETSRSAPSRLLNWAVSAVHHNAPLGVDTDLGWRVLELQWRTTFCKEALVYHAVTPASVRQWIFEGAYYAYAAPALVRKHPGLRRHMFAWLFATPCSAVFLIFVAGCVAAVAVHPGFLLACVPYAYHRCAEKSRIFRGILKPFRFFAYLPRDLMTFVFHVLGSLRHRTAVL